MRSVRTLKAAVLSVAVGSALLLSGCGGGSEAAPKETTTATVVLEGANTLTASPGSTGVVLTEFTDFQCPYCAGVHESMEGIAEKYEGKIDLAVRNFPLPMHQNSKIAAHAVEAAVLQGPENLKAFSGELYETQDKWGTLGEKEAKEYFVTVAEKLNLDKDKFVADSDSDAVKDRVAADAKAAEDLKLQGTPSMFIGTTPIDLSKISSDADIHKLVDDAIADAESKGTASPSASTKAP